VRHGEREKMNVFRGRILLVVAAALMWLSCLHGPAAASVISLLELVNGQNISALDKTFSNWTVLDTRLASEDLGLILVEALEDILHLPAKARIELGERQTIVFPPTLPLPLEVTRDVLRWFEATARPATIAILRW
jgi:hypothetical protein